MISKERKNNYNLLNKYNLYSLFNKIFLLYNFKCHLNKYY